MTLPKYLEESGLDLPDVYDGTRGWSDLCEAASVPIAPPRTHETSLRKAVGRLLHIDDDERIATYRPLLEASAPVDVSTLPERERRLVRVLVASLGDQVLTKEQSLQAPVNLVWSHPQVCVELSQLLVELDDRDDHLHGRLDHHPDVPLQVHAWYSRIEILAAFGIGESGRVGEWREGVSARNR